MTVLGLIEILSAQLTTQNGQLADATRRGDLVEIVRLEALISSTEQTLVLLRSLL